MAASDFEIKFEFRNGTIHKVTGPYGEGRKINAQDIKFKDSTYGLPFVDAAIDTTDPDPLLLKCYMIIGGYRVQVPCP
jgi:hypothetical protein